MPSVVGPGLGQPPLHEAGERPCAVLGRVLLHAQGVGFLRDVRTGPDHLGHPPVVVREQVAGGIDDGGRAPVVDLERVVGGAGEQAGEVEQERRDRRRRGRR